MAFGTFSAPKDWEEFPDEFEQHTFGPIAAATITNARISLMVTDREVDVEQITARATTAGSDHQITFYKAASGTALASGTSMGSGSATGLTAHTATKFDLVSNTGLAAGTVIGVGGASGLATLDDLVITIRTRTRRPRLSDGGQEVWNG